MKNNPLPDMLAGKENGNWRKFSTQEVKETVDKISAGLLQTGISGNDMTAEGRDKISIVSKNRPEWVMIDLAVMQIGAVLTPIYPTININELEFILNDAEVKILICNNKEDYEKAMSIKDAVPSLKEVFTIEEVEGIPSLKDLMNRATPEAIAEIQQHSSKIGYEDLATIIYTSGTTGKPKGVMLSHKNMLSNVMASIPCFPPGENMRSLSILPLNHVFERMISYIYLFKGTSMYFAESLETIADNLREVKPDLFTTVPRLLEKVYEKIMIKGSELTGIKKKLFFWAHSLDIKFEINKNMGAWYNLQLALANKLIFNK
jgi:long-chain acyl-CoA synthetase